MAFIVAGAIVGGVKAVQSGIQAHKDFNDPAGPQPRYDSLGNPKKPGPVYGWVMKAEKQMEERKNKKAHGGHFRGEERDPPVVEVSLICLSVLRIRPYAYGGFCWVGRGNVEEVG